MDRQSGTSYQLFNDSIRVIREVLKGISVEEAERYPIRIPGLYQTLAYFQKAAIAEGVFGEEMFECSGCEFVTATVMMDYPGVCPKCGYVQRPIGF